MSRKPNLMDFIYDRLRLNKPFDQLFNPYSPQTLQNTLKHFERLEEYEKCQLIVKFL